MIMMAAEKKEGYEPTMPPFSPTHVFEDPIDDDLQGYEQGYEPTTPPPSHVFEDPIDDGLRG